MAGSLNGGGESGEAKVDLWMKMTLCQQLADIHRDRTGKEGDDGTRKLFTAKPPLDRELRKYQ